MRPWVPYTPDFVRRRYDRLAPLYPIFEWLWLPRGMRAAAVDRLSLRAGERVLEVGCGTGRNFTYLVAAVGHEGRVYGVDHSEGMLRRARTLCARRSWENVLLLQADSIGYELPDQVNAALFSLSYATMPHHRQALQYAWDQLLPGGRLVVMDAKTPSGIPGRLLRPFLTWTSRVTVLGDPDAHPWEDLRGIAERVELEERFGGTYFICRSIKPLAAVRGGARNLQ